MHENLCLPIDHLNKTISGDTWKFLLKDVAWYYKLRFVYCVTVWLGQIACRFFACQGHLRSSLHTFSNDLRARLCRVTLRLANFGARPVTETSCLWANFWSVIQAVSSLPANMHLPGHIGHFAGFLVKLSARKTDASHFDLKIYADPIKDW